MDHIEFRMVPLQMVLAEGNVGIFELCCREFLFQIFEFTLIAGLTKKFSQD